MHLIRLLYLVEVYKVWVEYGGLQLRVSLADIPKLNDQHTLVHSVGDAGALDEEAGGKDLVGVVGRKPGRTWKCLLIAGVFKKVVVLVLLPTVFKKNLFAVQYFPR